jgi:hypothetical protein
MRLIAFLLLNLFACVAFAQKNNPKNFASTITTADLKKHLVVIAGKEMGGRDTPSPGLEKAANYIENHFKSIGLKPGNGDSYRQHYTLYRDSMLSSSLIVNGKKFELNKDYQPITNSNYKGELKIGEAVFAGYGIVDSAIDHYANLDVTGKVVVIVDGMPSDYKSAARGFNAPASTTGKLRNAMKKGAAAVIFVAGNFPRKSMTSMNSNWSMNGYRTTQYPMAFTVSTEVAEAIMGEDGKGIFDKLKTAPAVVKTYRANIDLSYDKSSMTTEVSNVLGVVEGSDLKNEYVIITAHYDHVGQRGDTAIFYGADDDGSGTVGVLELAEAYAKAKAAGNGPRRTMVFMTVSGEEKGLWGSRYYSEHPVYPLERTTVDLNIDMIGRIGTEYQKSKDSMNYIYLIGDDKLSSDLTPIVDMVNSKYMKMKMDRKYNDPNDPNRFYFRSDHYNFAEKGVPVLFYFNGTHADYHRQTDTEDKINYNVMVKRAQLVFYTAWEMANRDGMLKRDLKLERPKGF